MDLYFAEILKNKITFFRILNLNWIYQLQSKTVVQIVTLRLSITSPIFRIQLYFILLYNTFTAVKNEELSRLKAHRNTWKLN